MHSLGVRLFHSYMREVGARILAEVDFLVLMKRYPFVGYYSLYNILQGCQSEKLESKEKEKKKKGLRKKLVLDIILYFVFVHNV